MNRLELREQILCCEECELYQRSNGPVPFSGPTPAHLAVIGEAPGWEEDLNGEPFIGRSGQLLRDHMRKVGIDTAQVFFANVVSCWPKDPVTPTWQHENACGNNLADQLELANPRWVLLCGNTALHVLRDDLKITKARGHVFCPPGKARYLATVHPSFALRNHKGELLLQRDLELLVEMMDAGPDWLLKASDTCLSCGVEVDELVEHDGWLMFEPDGAVFCNTCFDRNNGAGDREKRDPTKPRLPPIPEALPVPRTEQALLFA